MDAEMIASGVTLLSGGRHKDIPGNTTVQGHWIDAVSNYGGLIDSVIRRCRARLQD
jgi:hypothetical protein